MTVKKSGKIVYGMDLTATEKKALDIEIKKSMAEYTKKNLMEVDSVILWILHEKCGFGKKRLRDFYDNFHIAIKELADRYEMDGEEIYLCTKKLKEQVDVDIEKWHEEKEYRLIKEGV